MTGKPIFAAPIAATAPQGFAAAPAAGPRHFDITCRFAARSVQSAVFATVCHISVTSVH